MKKAVILFNLGGPDKLENVEPFLFNLFYDPAILNLPVFSITSIQALQCPPIPINIISFFKTKN